MSDLVVLGHADGPRGRAYAASLARAGLAPARWVSYRSVWEGTPPSVTPGAIVRLESPSDDPGLDGDLVRVGGGTPGASTELLPGGPWFAGLTTLLTRVESWLGTHRTGMHDVPSVLAMTDKAAAHRRLRAAGVPVADGFTPDSAATWAEVRTRAEEAGWGQVVIKARYGSSAAGLLAVRWSGDHVAGWTTVALDDAGPAGPGSELRAYNTRRLVRLQSHAEVAAIVRALRWIHVERWLPKMSFAGGVVDLRVVVIGGRATQVLPRIGTGPFTNLHLGARRGDAETLRTHLGTAAWEALLAAAEGAAACFPKALYCGVDVGPVGPQRRPAVWEINAFGDFHEGVEMGGLDTYQSQLAALGILRRAA